MKPLPQNPVPGYLGKCIAEGEHQQQDFKFAINDSKKIAITLAAFANTDGGRLLIGVKDNGKIAGVHSDEEMYMVEGAADLYCQPPVPLQFQSWEFENKRILEVWVAPSAQRPHKAKTDDGKWLAYIRIGDENFLASPVHLKLWQQQDKKEGDVPGKFSEDEKQILHLITEVSDGITLNQICKKIQLPRRTIIGTLATLIRWKLLEIKRENDQFQIKLKTEGGT